MRINAAQNDPSEDENFEREGAARCMLISPLEGEMSGRTEGGTTRHAFKNKNARLHSRALP
jgi:hypothetical protein